MLQQLFYRGPSIDVLHEEYAKKGRIDGEAPVRAHGQAQPSAAPSCAAPAPTADLFPSSAAGPRIGRGAHRRPGRPGVGATRRCSRLGELGSLSP